MSNLVRIDQIIEKSKPQIQAALPKHIGVERMARVALTEYRKIPDRIRNNLDPVSFLGAIVQCAQLGLEPGAALGHAYLIPFKNKRMSAQANRDVYETQLITGYRGMIDLARRSGAIESIGAYVIKENDVFEYAFGAEHKPKHIPPSFKDPRGNTIGAWADAKLTNHGYQFEVLNLEDLQKARSFSRSQYDGSPWDTHFDEMARKTAIRRLFKYLPVSIEIREAFEIEDLASANISQNHQRLIDDSFVPDWSPTEDHETMKAEIEEAGKLDLLESSRQKLKNALKEINPDRLKTTLKIDNIDVVDSWDQKKVEAAMSVVSSMKS